MNKQHLPVVVLISGNGSNLQALIDYSRDNNPAYAIAAVISNRPDVYGLQRAANASIPQHVINHEQYESREHFDATLIATIDHYRPMAIVLAGFMRMFTDHFIQHYWNCLLNIHPSLLPKYKGLHTHQRALDAGDQYHGPSVHFVTPELDSGPVIMQSKINIQPNDTAKSLQQRVHTREHLIYPLCVDWFVSGRLAFRNQHIWLDNKLLQSPLLYEDIKKDKHVYRP